MVLRFCKCRIRLLGISLLWAALAACASPAWAQAAWQANGLPACSVPEAQESPYIVSLGGSGTIVAWADRRGYDYDIYVQRLDSAGQEMWAAGGVRLCGAEYDQQFPIAVADGSGGAIVVWQDGRLGDDGLAIYAQRVRPDGTMAWPTDGVPVCAYEAGLSDPPTAFSHVIASDGGGGAIVAWRDTRNDPVTGNTEIYAQRVNSSGTALWTPSGVKVLGFTTVKWATRNPIIAPDGSGGAIVVWQDSRNSATSANDLYAQHITATGNASWTANGVLICNSPGDQGYPDITDLSNGESVVVWEDKRAGNYDIYGQKLSTLGAAMWGANGCLVCSSAGDQRTPRVVTDGSGGVVVAWTDKRSSSLYTDIYAQRLNSLGAPLWTNQGTAVCMAPGSQTRVRMIPSSPGSVILTWMDTRNETTIALYDLYTQALNADGSTQWTADGAPLAALTGSNQRQQQVVSDGAFGIYATWEDDRDAGDWNIYAQRLTPWSSVSDIAGAKSCAIGTRISLPARVVTGAFDGYFYIEEQERYAGIRVVSEQQVSVGDLVAVTGTVEQNDERCIIASSVTLNGTGLTPGALGLTIARLGGTSVGSAQGLSTIGLLVRVCGTVKEETMTPTPCIVVSDGSADVRIYGPADSQPGDYVIVTGISSCEAGPLGLAPTMLLRESTDARLVSAQ